MRYAETKSFEKLMLTWFLVGLTTLGVQALSHGMDFALLSATNLLYLSASDDPGAIRLLFRTGEEATRSFHSAMVIWTGFFAVIFLCVYLKLKQCRRYQRAALIAFIPIATFGCVYLPFEMADLIKSGFMSDYTEAKNLLKPEVNESGFVAKGKEFAEGFFFESGRDIIGYVIMAIIFIAKLSFMAAHAVFFALAIPVLRERLGLLPKV